MSFPPIAYSAVDLPRRRRTVAPADSLWIGAPDEEWSQKPASQRRSVAYASEAPGGGLGGQEAGAVMSQKERLAAERKAR